MNGIENFFECADLDFTHKAELAAEDARMLHDNHGQRNTFEDFP